MDQRVNGASGQKRARHPAKHKWHGDRMAYTHRRICWKNTSRRVANVEYVLYVFY